MCCGGFTSGLKYFTTYPQTTGHPTDDITPLQNKPTSFAINCLSLFFLFVFFTITYLSGETDIIFESAFGLMYNAKHDYRCPIATTAGLYLTVTFSQKG